MASSSWWNSARSRGTASVLRQGHGLVSATRDRPERTRAAGRPGPVFHDAA
ncbi:hypothetical protein ACWDE9_32585 [Streptomyces olivaceoviridis]